MTAALPAIADLTDFSPESRLWVYVSDRPLSAHEAATTQQALSQFCRQWTAHNQALKAASEVFANQVLLLMVDETQAGASGCSIDKSVHFLEQLGQSLGADFFERMRFAWLDEEGRLRFANRQQLAEAIEQKLIQEQTLMLNTLVQTKRELNEKWLIPYQQSWHKRL